MAEWPDFLAALGKNKSGPAAAFLAKYLQYPIAEIRASAATGLANLAREVPAEVQAGLRDLNVVVASARDDNDPRVRRDARCTLFHLGKANLLDNIKELSPFVTEGYEACKTKNATNQGKDQ